MSDQMGMFEEAPTLPYQPHSGTSKEAAEKMRPAASSDRARILKFLTGKLGGMTDEEMQRALKLNPNTQRPRRIELVVAGKVRDSGKTRETASGRKATIWEAVG